MPSGGARSNSGPPPDPTSAKSEKRGTQLVTLPAGGFTGKIPSFPLPEKTKREATMWRWLWRTPQAAQWSKESWRLMFVGNYCRMLVRMEAGDSSGTVAQNALKLAEQLGMTPHGLRLNGWVLGVDETAVKREEKRTESAGGERRRNFGVVAS